MKPESLMWRQLRRREYVPGLYTARHIMEVCSRSRRANRKEAAAHAERNWDEV